MDDRPDSRSSRAFSIGLAIVAILVTAGLVVISPPDFGVVAVFTVLLIIGDRIEIELESGTNESPIFLLVVASILVFGVEGALGGAVLARLISALCYLPEWKSRKWAKLCFNTGMFTLATAVAAGLVSLLPISVFDSLIGVMLVGVIAAAGLAFTNLILLASVDYLADGKSPRSVALEVLPYQFTEIPFGVLGAVFGYLYIHVGTIMVPLLVAPILIAKQAFASYLELKDTQEAATNTLIRALEAKDSYTAGHVERVAVYAEYIGRELQFTPGRLERLRLAALMHDIGKLIVPNELLNKPGKLTEDEFARVKEHEHVSMELLSRIQFLAPVAPSASSEHTDYRPDDERHPIEPYIVHVADAYDAMTSTRSYRKALSQGVAFAELRDKAGAQFHPVVVEALVTAIRTRGEVHGRGHEDEQHLWAVPPPEAGTGSAGLGDFAPGREQEA